MLEKQRITIGDYAIDVRLRLLNNKAQSIVLIHGIGVSGSYFLPLAKALSKNYNVFVLDLLGWGKTPKPARALTIEQLASVCEDMISHFKLHKPILIGNSMGSQIAAHVAKQQPLLCSKLILLSPTINRRERHLLKQSWRLLQDTVHEPPHLNAIVFKDYARMGVIRYLKTCRFMLRDRIEDTLHETTVPILFIRGEKDPVVPHDWLNYLTASVPNSKSHEVKGATHLLHFNQPKQLKKLCHDFINT